MTAPANFEPDFMEDARRMIEAKRTYPDAYRIMVEDRRIARHITTQTWEEATR